MTKMDLDKIVVEWHHHPPLTYLHELFAYAVVCTPTDGKLGPTLTTVRGNINRTEVHRLRPGTNYSLEIVALVIDNQTEEITLEKSQRNSLETDEGGETILVIEIFGTSRPPPPLPRPPPPQKKNIAPLPAAKQATRCMCFRTGLLTRDRKQPRPRQQRRRKDIIGVMLSKITALHVRHAFFSPFR